MNMFKINAVYENVESFVNDIKKNDIAVTNGIYNLYFTHDSRYRVEKPLIIDIYDKKDVFLKQIYNPTTIQLTHIYHNYHGIYDNTKKCFSDFIL